MIECVILWCPIYSLAIDIKHRPHVAFLKPSLSESHATSTMNPNNDGLEAMTRWRLLKVPFAQEHDLDVA